MALNDSPVQVQQPLLKDVVSRAARSAARKDASPITLFEHEVTRNFRATQRELVLLTRLNERLGVEVLRPVVQGSQLELRAQQFVGVVRLGERTLQILPKLHRHGEAGAVSEATRNLLHLLEYASDVRIRESALAPLLRNDTDWFEVLTALFATNLLEEYRRGPVRRYERRDDTLGVLKGQWRISESLRRPERRHLFDVTYDEFTEDNPLNRVFRYVVERLWRSTRNAQNKLTLALLRQSLDAAGVALSAHAPRAEAVQLVLSRLEARFGPVLSLARLFLQNKSLELFSGDMNTFAFVFDMNVLFESFVAGFVQRHRNVVLPAALATCSVLPQARGHTLAFANRGGRPAFTLKPDILFKDTTGHPLIVDTKYKNLKPSAAANGVAEADAYQMFAYAHRYACPRIVLLYPQTAELTAPVRQTLHVEASTVTIAVATVDVRRNLASKEGKLAVQQELRDILEGTTWNT